MTDFANLAMKIDSSGVKSGVAELDKLTAAGKKAEGAVDKLGDAAAETGAQMRGAGRGAAEMAAQAQNAARQATGMGESGRLAGHHMQNLAFQINDVIVGLVSGQKPMTVFMQQGSQIGQIAMQSGVGFGSMAKQVGSLIFSLARAHPVLAGIATAGAVAAAGIKLLANELNNTGELQRYVDSMGLSKKATKELGEVGITAGDVMHGLWRTINEGLGLDKVFTSIGDWAKWAFEKLLKGGEYAAAGVYAAWVGSYNGLKATWSSLPAVLGSAMIGGVNLAIGAVETLINKASDGINSLIDLVNPLLEKAGFGGIGHLGGVSLGRMSNPFAGAAANAGSAFADAFTGAFDQAMGKMDALGAKIGANIMQSAKDRIKQEIDDKGLLDEGAKKKAGKKAGKDLGEAFVEEMRVKMADLTASLMVSAGKQATLDFKWDSKHFDDEQIQAANDLWKAEQRRSKELAEQRAILIAQKGAYIGIAQSIASMGGVGSVIGGLLGAINGDTGGLSPAWQNVLGIKLGGKVDTFGADGVKTGERDRTLLDGITKIFDGKDGKFGKTMSQVLQTAGGGIAIGSALFGSQNTGAQLGGAIGAIAGKSIGEGIKALGKVGGPLGEIVGSVLGSIIGGLFGTKPRGSASISNTRISSSANDGGIKSNLDSFGLGLQSTVSKIADQLGGTVGNYNVGLGMYKDYYQVSSSANDPRLGQTYFGKKSSSALYDGKDPAAAMRAAISAAIAQGAIAGVRAGVNTLLQAGSDIERQLAKAVKFNNVFDELKAELDPMGAALDKVNKQFAELNDIFKEAGATAEDYAKLQQLATIKQQQAAEDARKAIVDKVRDPLNMQIQILELLGKSEDALAATRLVELAGLKDSLQPLQSWIYQLTDARQVIDTFSPLAEDLKKYRVELLGGNASNGFGYVSAQFRAAALSAANGDAGGMRDLRGTASAFLESAKANASSALDYKRAVSEVLTSVDKGIFAAETQIDYAQAQIDAINNSANIMAAMKAEIATFQAQITENTGLTARLLKRFDGDGGLLITAQSDAPLPVTVVS